MWRKNDGTTRGATKQTGEEHEKESTVVQSRRCQDTHGADLCADKWSEGTPPGIEITDSGDRNARHSKQDQEAPGDVGKIGAQGEGETSDQLTRGERDEGDMINLEARIMRLEEQTQWMYDKREGWWDSAKQVWMKGCCLEA